MRDLAMCKTLQGKHLVTEVTTCQAYVMCLTGKSKLDEPAHTRLFLSDWRYDIDVMNLTWPVRERADPSGPSRTNPVAFWRWKRGRQREHEVVGGQNDRPLPKRMLPRGSSRPRRIRHAHEAEDHVAALGGLVLQANLAQRFPCVLPCRTQSLSTALKLTVYGVAAPLEPKEDNM